MKWGKRIVGIGLALIVAGGLIYAFLPGPAKVTVARVRQGPMAVTVDQEGRTRVRDRYLVSAPLAGDAGRIDLEVGDPVTSGDVLTRIEPMPASLLDPRNRAQAKASVAGAEAAVQAAEARRQAADAAAHRSATELARVRSMHAKGYATDQELDIAQASNREAQADRRSARYQVQGARADLESARAMLQYGASGLPREAVPVKAPVAGRVLAVHHESAGPVTSGTELIEIGDPGAIEVKTDVLSSDAVRIHPGMAVRLQRWGGDRDLEGQVTRVEPTAFTKVSALGIEEQRVWVVSRITSPPDLWRRLGDGYRVDCSFVLWSGDDVLQVPDSAVFDHKGDQAVFVLTGGRARLRRIELGHRSGLDVQVLQGLEPGETVVTHPDETVADGVAVTVRGSAR